jgi:hypothetical protein
VSEFNTILLESLREATLVMGSSEGEERSRVEEDPVGDYFFGRKLVVSRGGETMGVVGDGGEFLILDDYYFF